MTKEEVIEKVSTNFNYIGTRSIIVGVINELEEMGLIKFESEREAAIKEAKTYISDIVYADNDDRLLTIRNMSNVIKRLVALLK